MSSKLSLCNWFYCFWNRIVNNTVCLAVPSQQSVYKNYSIFLWRSMIVAVTCFQKLVVFLFVAAEALYALSSDELIRLCQLCMQIRCILFFSLHSLDVRCSYKHYSAIIFWVRGRYSVIQFFRRANFAVIVLVGIIWLSCLLFTYT